MKNPIIILGSGRCGSTLLQRILNTSEHLTIWGEHEGFLAKLAESYYVLTESEGMKRNYYSKSIDPEIIIGSLTDYHASPNWINSFNKSTIKESYRLAIANLLNNQLNTEEKYWGFKEIRYSQDDLAMNMWSELFPDSLVIFSIRNPFAVIRSMITDWIEPETIHRLMQQSDRQQLQQLVLNYARRWNRVVSSFPYWIEEQKFTYHVERYEDLLINPEKNIAQIFNFLNLPIPATASKPITVRIGSRKSPYKSEISEIIRDMQQDIWQIAGNTAEYFDYGLDIAKNLNF